MRWIISIISNSIVLIVIAGIFKILVPSSFYIENVTTAVAASIVLALLNAFIKPLLIVVTLPITVVTFGLFLIVINAITLKIADSLLGASFDIKGFGTAVAVAVCISVLNMLIDKVIVEPLSRKD
ncbi:MULTISPECIES: phage holin family protein [Bacillaceae]|jgi:putative membrane protein|uniref:phage holin family protein n=1 Tax=Bacillaceae TaxID=186817 RepID=UPI00101D405E|nr:phage holin family protein [Ectobacillus funiculus]